MKRTTGGFMPTQQARHKRLGRRRGNAALAELYETIRKTHARIDAVARDEAAMSDNDRASLTKQFDVLARRDAIQPR